ncbi:TetR/AcrR family transcriptional regulator [Streptomyces sp. NPDC056296]|uniref:TetR/AcrR family transcriptional regulator n=1 Tax=Streptomyces sp. NPDC056296 TaxID=3345775 RepID=UPI0035E159B7
MAGRLRAPTGRYGGKSAAQRQAERRDRFLAAALQLFGDTPGYRGTTVAALSEAAGLSTRQFYEEFRTLEDVLAALHLQVNAWAEEAVLAAAADARELPLPERAAAIFRAYAADVTGDPRRVRITFVEIIGVSPRLEEQRLARRARWVDLICAEARSAAARGEAATRDYRLAATAFIGGVNGLLHDYSAGWVDATLDEVVDELVRQLLAVLRPPGWSPAPAS